MKEETRRALLSAMLEAGFVVLGVALALLANEWRQNVADRRSGEVALDSVLVELAENQASLEASLEYHSGLIETITTSLESDRRLQANDFPEGFIRPATTFRTAWQMAGQTGALAHLSFDTRLTLSRLYAQQERYEKQSEMAGGIIYQALFEGGTAEVVARPVPMMTLISSFAYRERELLEEYRRALERVRPEGES